jgi:quercetin dioxygenase-like cupin family protein
MAAFYQWTDLGAELITPKYSTAFGPNLKVETMEVGLFTYPPNTQAKEHAHPNEQVMVVLKGRGKWKVGDEEKILGPGELVYMKPNVLHGLQTLDEELQVVNCKSVVPGWSVKHARWEKEPER